MSLPRAVLVASKRLWSSLDYTFNTLLARLCSLSCPRELSDEFQLTTVIPKEKRAFQEVLDRANKEMRSVFGLEIVELRARRKGDIDDIGATQTQTQRKKKKKRRRNEDLDAESEASASEEEEEVAVKSQSTAW